MIKKLKKLYDSYLIMRAESYLNLLEMIPKESPMWLNIWSNAWWLSLEMQERNIDVN
jgi:hypothetical protein